MVSFEEMKFDEACRLVTEISSYCPPMLDGEPFSHYQADSLLLEKHLDVISRQFRQGKMAPETEKRLKTIQSLSVDNPDSYLIQHHIAILRKDLTESIQTLHTYCSHASVYEKSEARKYPPSDEAFKKIHDMCLKMASFEDSFDQTQRSRLALDDSFELTRKFGDEKALLSCLVLMVQVMLQSPPQVTRDTNSLDAVNRLLERCCQKSRELKLPHILAFSVMGKSLMALRHGLIQGHKANTAEVHRLVTATERSLRRLRDYVSAATAVLNVQTRPRDGDESVFETYKLFLNALSIFDPDIKEIDPSISMTMDQLVSTMQMYTALSWKRAGHHSLGLISALSVEITFGKQACLTDRAEALAHVALTLSDRKGSTVGRRVLSCAEKIEGINGKLPLKAADKFMALETSLTKTSPNASQAWWTMQNSLTNGFTAWTSNQVPLSTDTYISRESVIIQSLMALDKTRKSAKQIRKLTDTCDIGQLTQRESEVLLLHSRLDDRQDNPDLIAAFLSETGDCTEDVDWNLHSAEAAVFSCKSLLMTQRDSSKEVEKILTSLLPFVLSEGTLRLHADVLLLLWYTKAPTLNKDAPNNPAFSVLKHAIQILALLGDWVQVQSICSMAHGLWNDPGQEALRADFFRDLKRLCVSYGAESAGMSFQCNTWPQDVMDID